MKDWKYLRVTALPENKRVPILLCGRVWLQDEPTCCCAVSAHGICDLTDMQAMVASASQRCA